jgi:DNA repair exonuclease SbcCD nuclease subunit
MVTRIGIVPDLHARLMTPSSRKDSYFAAFMQKLEFILSNCDVMIQLGDWFDKAHTEDVVKNMILDCINAHNVPIYIVPGNHDIDKDTMETLPKTSLGNLIKHKAVTLLTPDKVWNISGLKVGVLDYDIKEAKKQSFEDIDIVVGHHFYNWERDLEFSLVEEDIPKFNTKHLFLGHDHEPHPIEQVGNTQIHRLGSVMRTELKEYTKDHMPKFCAIDVNSSGEIENIEYVPISCAKKFEDAFRYEEKKTFKRCTKLISDIKGFLESIDIQPSAKRTLGQILEEDLKAPKEVRDYIMLIYRANNISF